MRTRRSVVRSSCSQGCPARVCVLGNAGSRGCMRSLTTKNQTIGQKLYHHHQESVATTVRDGFAGVIIRAKHSAAPSEYLINLIHASSSPSRMLPLISTQQNMTTKKMALWYVLLRTEILSSEDRRRVTSKTIPPLSCLQERVLQIEIGRKLRLHQTRLSR